MAIHSAPRLRAVLALTGSLALAATLLAATPAAAASPTACRVKNLDTGVTKASLQKAHNAARQGQRLTVRGTCAGITTIRKSLRITGVQTESSGKPILDAKLNGTVVTVRPGVTVTLRGLTIRNGATPDQGGGILNGGTLVLRDVVVRASTADAGGGVYSVEGTLTLNGSTSIRGNSAGVGGGVYTYFGTVTMNGSSSVRGNTARFSGGGVLNDGGTFRMQHSSAIRGNTSGEAGGGVFNAGYLEMTGSSSITHNSAAMDGGISMHSHPWNAVGVICGPGGNVLDNSPDDGCRPAPD
jgi:hypothetical protein